MVSACLVAGVALLGTAGNVGVTAPGGPRGSAGTALLVRPAAACPGNAQSPTVRGTLGVEGNVSPYPSVSSVNLTIGFSYQSAVTPSGGSTSYACVQTAFVVTTAVNGSFIGNFTLPPSGCNHAGCTEYTGPYAAFSVTLTDAPPLGYLLNGSLTWPTSHLALVAALQRVSFLPVGPLTVSYDAPTTIRAAGWTADDRPSPANLTFHFSVAAPQWRVENATVGAVTLLALASAPPTNLLAVANGTLAGRSLTGVSAQLPINAIGTNITGAGVDPTELDVGAVAAFSVLGSGSEGYNYTATLHPGLGAALANRSCLQGSAAGGAVSVACSVSFTYGQVGAAQPFVVLSNGYSSATWTFPELVVRSALELTGTPAELRGYVGAPLPVTIAIAEGSGTAPFGPACLATGVGAILCQMSAGPAWTFDPTYDRTGTFEATGTVVDAASSNATIGLPVTISTRPSLGGLVASSQAPESGSPVELSASLIGGMAPFEVWWNDSLPRTTLASSVANATGTLQLEFTPESPGHHLLTLTVLDSLGTVVAAQIALVVQPPAVELGWSSGAPPTSLTAGTSSVISLFAESGEGTRSPSFAAPISLDVLAGPTAAPLWINGSVPGALDGIGGGVFLFNATSWFGGYLNFTVSLLRTGIYEFRFVSPLPIASAPSGLLDVAVGPELHALRLVDPEVVHGGGRTNSTLWRLADPFGNPAPAGELYLMEDFGGPARESTVPIEANASSAWAWVNYTAPDASAGSITIVTEWNETLAVLAIPASPAGNEPPLFVLGATGSAAALAVATTILVRRRRALPPPSGEVEAEELHRHAEGRAQLLDRIRREGPIALDALLEGVDRAEASEWLASLVTEGLVTTQRPPGGAARFAAVRPKEGGVAASRLPRPVLDLGALDRLQLRREEESGGGRPGAPADHPRSDHP